VIRNNRGQLQREWAEARSASRSKMKGSVSEARSRRAGGKPCRELVSVGTKDFIIDPLAKFLGAEGGEKKMSTEFSNRMEKGRTGGGTGGKGMSTCRSIRSHKDYALRLHSCLASA
jgi:hypothetical protein